jgi:hypothetical protein
VRGRSIPSSFLTRSRRFRRCKSPDTRHDFHPSTPTQIAVAAGGLVTHVEITGRRAKDLSHACARPVIVRADA